MVMTTLERLATKKELSLGWLGSFLLAAFANFAAVVWMASAVVSDVNSLKETVKALAISSAIAAVTDATQNAQIEESRRRLEESVSHNKH